MMRKFLAPLAAFACLAALAAPSQAAIISTGYAGGNGNDGIMFDVNVFGQMITIKNFQTSFEDVVSDFEIWYRVGGVGGQQNNDSAWTALATFTDLQTSGSGNASFFGVGAFELAANTTYGFYITDARGLDALDYTNGLEQGVAIAANGNLAIQSGYGVTYPFGDFVGPRNFNGAIEYVVGNRFAVPEPATWAMMLTGFGLTGGALRARRREKLALA